MSQKRIAISLTVLEIQRQKWTGGIFIPQLPGYGLIGNRPIIGRCLAPIIGRPIIGQCVIGASLEMSTRPALQLEYGTLYFLIERRLSVEM